VGAYGQLGKALVAKYPKATAVDRDTFDMTDWTMVEGYDWSKFDIILNAAVFANVDGAETPEGRVAAWGVNATGVGYLAKVAAAHDLTLVHVSSDYVFDGTKSPHTEDEAFAPLGVYAQSKTAGDIATSTAPKHYIFRISWLIGDGPNFVRTMMGLAAKDISPKVVSDQIGRLTFADTLAGVIDEALQKKLPFGTYNASGDGKSASWAEITRAIFKELGRNDLTVTDTTTEEYFASKPGVAPRPLQSELDLSKIKAAGIQIRDWREDLHDYIKAEQAKPKES
jgi:dTDP-4-dehydrorhamnose 3,5-epimerase/reductase